MALPSTSLNKEVGTSLSYSSCLATTGLPKNRCDPSACAENRNHNRRESQHFPDLLLLAFSVKKQFRVETASFWCNFDPKLHHFNEVLTRKLETASNYPPLSLSLSISLYLSLSLSISLYLSLSLCLCIYVCLYIHIYIWNRNNKKKTRIFLSSEP